MLIENLSRYKNLFFAIIVVGLVLIGWLIYTVIDRHDTREVKLTAIPADASITVNGIPFNESEYLPFGTYTLKASKDGFITKESELKVNAEGDYTNTEPLFLNPESKEAITWYENNLKLYGEEYKPEANLDNVFNFIPFQSLLFSVEHGGDENSGPNDPITLNTSSLGIYKNAPIEYLKRNKIDPSGYLYKFNYESPF